MAPASSRWPNLGDVYLLTRRYELTAGSVADALSAVAEHRDVPLTSLAEELGVERRSVMTNRPRTLSVTFLAAFPGLIFVP